MFRVMNTSAGPTTIAFQTALSLILCSLIFASNKVMVKTGVLWFYLTVFTVHIYPRTPLV
jgi:hypothetical protein